AAGRGARRRLVPGGYDTVAGTPHGRAGNGDGAGAPRGPGAGRPGDARHAGRHRAALAVPRRPAPADPAAERGTRLDAAGRRPGPLSRRQPGRPRGRCGRPAPVPWPNLITNEEGFMTMRSHPLLGAVLAVAALALGAQSARADITVY